jgi:hypothetical protein
MLTKLLMNIVSVSYKYTKYNGIMEYTSACPFCKEGIDRFIIWSNQGLSGRYFCRRCRHSGTGIDLAMLIFGYNQQKAEDYFKNGTCSMSGDDKLSTKLTIESIKPDQNIWMQKAEDLLKFLQRNLRLYYASNPELSRRGITKETAVKYGLGLNMNEIKQSITQWGFDDKEGAYTRLSIPPGVVVPRKINGQLVGLKVRRTDEADGNKNFCVKGSYAGPIMISELGHKSLCLVENDLDAVLLAQECSDLVDVCSLGYASARIYPQSGIDLNRYSQLLVALDNDQAGRESFARYWSNVHPNAALCLVPAGKDVGEAYINGVDLRRWIEKI